MTLDKLAKHLGEAPTQDAVRTACSSLSDHDMGSAVVAGYWCSHVPDGLRPVVPLAARGEFRGPTDWILWTALLLPPYPLDATTLLNVLSSVGEDGGWPMPIAASPAGSLLGGFLLHALAQPALVAERAVDLLGVLPGAALAALDESTFEQLLGAARSRAAEVVDDIVREELERCIADAVAARALAPPHRRTSALRLRAELDDVSMGLGAGAAARLAASALTRLEAYVVGLALDHEVRVVQRVQIKPSRGDSALDDRRVGAAISAWSRFNQWWIPTLSTTGARAVPTAATSGSFRLDLVVQAIGNDVYAVLRAADQVADQSSGDQHLIDEHAEPWRRLIDILDEFSLSLHVVHYWGAFESRAIELTPASMPGVRRRAAVAPVKVPSLDVPQADVIRKVFLIAELSSKAELVTPEALEVDVRDLNYYRRAAKILGLLDEEDAITPAGRQLVRLADDDRLRTAAVLFEGSVVGDAWVSYAQGTTLLDVDPASAADFLAAHSLLTGKTIGRRARTLQAWHAAVAPFHYAVRPL